MLRKLLHLLSISCSYSISFSIQGCNDNLCMLLCIHMQLSSSLIDLKYSAYIDGKKFLIRNLLRDLGLKRLDAISCLKKF